MSFLNKIFNQTPNELEESEGENMDMTEFVANIARALVDNPEEVDVREVTGERTIVYELRVNENDLGKVIGRGGQTARSIRTLLSAVAAKQGKRAVLEIIE